MQGRGSVTDGVGPRGLKLAYFLRGKNIRACGNGSEHLHNWTAGQFIRMVGGYFQVERVFYPFPWTLALCCK